MSRGSKFLSLMIALQVLVSLSAQAMNMKSYDLTSLVFLSTDIVIATVSVDDDKKYIATVKESLYGSVHPGDTLTTIDGFLHYFKPMKDGMRVILFLDRRPHQYDFIYREFAKSPFAIPPSGVYVVDGYNHVHSYFQVNNPGPYVAAGYYRDFRTISEPTEEQDLKFPSLEQTRKEMDAAIKVIAPFRDLLEKSPTAAQAPALLELLDQTAPSKENCAVRTAAAVLEQAKQQIVSLNSAELLLQAHALAGDAGYNFSGPTFLAFSNHGDFTHENEATRREFAASRIRFLVLTLADRKRAVPLRIAALRLLLEISTSSHRYGYAVPLPIDGPDLLPFADQLSKAAQSIFEDESEDSQLRALSIRFIALDQPEASTPSAPLSMIRRVYASTHSDQVRYAIEAAFLTASHDLYDLLHSTTGPITSIVLPSQVGGCMKVTPGALVVHSEYHESKDFPERGFTRSILVLINVQTGQRTPIDNTRQLKGFSNVPYEANRFEITPPPDLLPGVYSLGFEETFQDKLFGTGHAMLVKVVRSATGQVSFQ